MENKELENRVEKLEKQNELLKEGLNNSFDEINNLKAELSQCNLKKDVDLGDDLEIIDFDSDNEDNNEENYGDMN